MLSCKAAAFLESIGGVTMYRNGLQQTTMDYNPNCNTHSFSGAIANIGSLTLTLILTLTVNDSLIMVPLKVKTSP